MLLQDQRLPDGLALARFQRIEAEHIRFQAALFWKATGCLVLRYPWPDYRCPLH